MPLIHALDRAATAIGKVKQTLYRPEQGLEQVLRSPEFRFPRFSKQSVNKGGNFVSFTHQPSLPPADADWVDPGKNAACRIELTKNSNDPMGDRTRDLKACSAVSPKTIKKQGHIIQSCCKFDWVQLPVMVTILASLNSFLPSSAINIGTVPVS